MTFGASLVGLALAFANTAPAERETKPSKRTPVEVKAIEPRATKAAAPAAPETPAGPSVTLEQFRADRRAKLKRLTDSQIAKMRQLIQVTGEDDPQRPDLLFRAGELYAENKRYFFDQARGLDQKIFNAPPAAKSALRAEQQAFEKHEQAWLLEAVRAYVDATHFPRYPRQDEVLFRLASLLTGAKKHDQAREFLHRLIKDHPTSRYIPDAYLAFAEHAFESGDMQSALRLYEKVAEFPKSSVYPYAVYKKGWCHINLTDYREALETFVAVVRLAQDRQRAGGDKQIDLLAREARKDVVRAYSHVGGPDRAWPFFQRIGGDAAQKMMEALGELYWEEGKFADSTRIYKKIAAENMTSGRICEWQGKILRNSLSAGDKRDQTQELERLGVVYEKTPGQKAPDVTACRNAFHDAARELALIWHREAQRTQNVDTYKLAARAYRTFLDHFPDDKDVYEMRYYDGELLWVLKRWREAAEEYTRVVEMNPQGKYLRDAAYAAVLAWQNELLGEDEEQRDRAERERIERERAVEAAARSPGKLAPRPIPEHQQKMIEAFRRYRRHVPDAPELPVILYREGYICYNYNHFDCAEKQFLEVVQRFPTHKLAVFAANLYLDALNAEGKKKEVVVWVRKFLDMPPLLQDPEFGQQLISLMSDAYDGEARDHDRRGNRKECGRSFLAAAEALPAHKKHAERLWNAGQCFQNAHLVGQAIKAWEALISAHPADPLAKKALYRVGAGYHQLAIYSTAATKYEAFAKAYPGEPQAVTALGNAAVFREGLGEGSEAIADMEAFVRYYAQRAPQDAAGVHFQIGEVYEKQGKLAELRTHLAGYLERWGARGGVDRQVQAHFRMGELAWKASCPRAQPDGACVEVTRVSSSRGRQVIDTARRRLRKEKLTQCGPATKSKIVVVERNRSQAADAEEHFRAAIRLWRAGDASNPGNPIVGREAEARRALAAYAAAGAAFYLAEKDYEELLRVKFPQNLDFSRPSANDSPRKRAATAKKLEDSNKRLGAYLGDKARLLEKARGDYLAVFKLRQAQWTIAAAARIGQLHQDFAGQLYTAGIPKDLPETDAWGNHPRDLYCWELEDRAAKIEAQATEGFSSCLGAATQESWFNEWSRLCERELNQLEPVRFPMSSELKPEAGFVPTVMSAARVVTELPEE